MCKIVANIFIVLIMLGITFFAYDGHQWALFGILCLSFLIYGIILVKGLFR